MFDMVIAQCPYCGARRYSWTEADAVEKLKKHKCIATLLDKELENILNHICERDNDKQE